VERFRQRIGVQPPLGWLSILRDLAFALGNRGIWCGFAPLRSKTDKASRHRSGVDDGR